MSIGDYMMPYKLPLTTVNPPKPKRKFTVIDEANYGLFYRNCMYGKGLCAVVFLNGEYDKTVRRTNLNYSKMLRMIKDIPSDVDKFPYGDKIDHYFYVNATCHDELVEYFKVRTGFLPTAVVYDSKFKLLNRMSMGEEFNLEKLGEFLDSTGDGKGLNRPLEPNRDIFKSKECAKIMIKHNVNLKFLDHEKITLYRFQEVSLI